MKITEFNVELSSKKLNESLAKQFGMKIDVANFTLEQLQDARNKIRTKVFNVETTESFDSVQKEEYSKNKLFLDVLNAAISEREDVAEAAKPDFLDLDGDGDKEEPMKKAADDKKNKGIEAMKKAGNAKADAEAGERKKTNEGKEDEAELVMAAKDMVDRVTSWMEDTAEMQTESMLELADAIRDEMGAQQSETFVNTVKPALEALYATMETTREALTGGVGMLTGEAEAPEAMGADDEMGMEPTADMDADLDADMAADEIEDDFATADAATGGDEEAGRARRESIDLSRRLGTILSS